MLIPVSDQFLKEYNRQGLIPGPSESESDYLARVAYCLQISKHLSEETNLPFCEAEFTELPVLPKQASTVELYDISPDWIPIIYNNYKLSLWHGGCAWIFQCKEESPLSALLQLRKVLGRKENLYGFFDKKEIIEHEICHIGRMAFEEPIFEEYFAYRTSKSTFRRSIGPIVKNSIESGVFVLLLGLIFTVDLFFALYGNEQALQWAMWLKMFPFGLAAYGTFRLAKRHRQLKNCLERLKKSCGSEALALAVAYRLTDREIILFSTSSIEEIRAYAKAQKKSSLRWRLIATIYFLES